MRQKFLPLMAGLLVFGAGRLAAQTNFTAVINKMRDETNSMAVAASNAPMARMVSTNSMSTNLTAAATGTSDSPVRLDSQYFRLISERNIFDQTRRPIRRNTNTTPVRPPDRIESFTLTGVGLDDKQGAAMFDSSSSLFRGTLKAGESIAGYRIAEIAPDLESIKLAAASNQVVTLRVGMQMRRRNSGPWLLASRSETVTATPTEGEPEKTDATNSATPATGGSMDDIIKRLMEKRAKE